MFVTLLIGHLIGDWLVQTDWQATNKMTSWRANQAHVATYHLVIAAMFALYAVTAHVAWGPLALGLVLISWPMHSLLDRRWPVQRFMQLTRSSGFAQTSFGPMVVDQVLHIVTLWIVAVVFLGA